MLALELVVLPHSGLIAIQRGVFAARASGVHRGMQMSTADRPKKRIQRTFLYGYSWAYVDYQFKIAQLIP